MRSSWTGLGTTEKDSRKETEQKKSENDSQICHRQTDGISSCAQSVHAIRTLLAHGICARKTHRQFSDVLSLPNLRTQPTPRGALLRRLIGREWRVIRRGVHSGLCRAGILTAAELIEDMDDNLFQRILRDKNHILHALLPDRRRSLEYELRPRSRDRELVPKVNSLTESNFLIRQLYKNCY